MTMPTTPLLPAQIHTGLPARAPRALGNGERPTRPWPLAGRAGKAVCPSRDHILHKGGVPMPQPLPCPHCPGTRFPTTVNLVPRPWRYGLQCTTCLCYWDHLNTVRFKGPLCTIKPEPVLQPTPAKQLNIFQALAQLPLWPWAKRP